ncbi:hypothetical protein QBC39DRAFT_346964 [Podospora conica]|nr:hypothetical protein QBC39DRAFT_346964 [Schizothecium conicum]
MLVTEASRRALPPFPLSVPFVPFVPLGVLFFFEPGLLAVSLIGPVPTKTRRSREVRLNIKRSGKGPKDPGSQNPRHLMNSACEKQREKRSRPFLASHAVRQHPPHPPPSSFCRQAGWHPTTPAAQRQPSVRLCPVSHLTQWHSQQKQEAACPDAAPI